MKTKLALIALVCSFAVMPAHAINAHYRAQLERSGCTQVSDGDGTCDIHKTKAQNAKAKSGSNAFTADADHVLNQPISTSAEYLLLKDGNLITVYGRNKVMYSLLKLKPIQS